MVVLAALLTTLLAGPTLARAPQPPGRPTPTTLQKEANTGTVPFQRKEAQSRQGSSVDLGEPGLSFRYVETFGETEVAYFEDSTHLNRPYGVGVDGADKLWVAEISGARAVKYTADGSFITSIGTAGLIGRADETHFYGVADVAVDGEGNAWVVDTNPDRVVKYDSNGNFLMQLGETWESGSDNDHFNEPRSIAFDSAGNIYVSDADNHRVQVFDNSGIHSTTIGVTGESGSDNAHFNTTRHIAIDSSDNLYVADAGNHRVQIFDSSHSHMATIGMPGEPGSDSNHFNWPMGVDVGADHIYVADFYNHRVQVFDRTTHAYLNTLGTGSADSGNNAFDYPSDVAVDSAGNVYVADQGNCRVQKFNSSLAYQRTFGTTGVPYLTDGYHYREPADVAIDASGNIGIVEGEGGGNRLIKLNANGVPRFTVGEAGVWGTDNAHFDEPRGVTFDAYGVIYVADTWNNRVQIFEAYGAYQATLGTGSGTDNYQFNHPRSIATDNSDNIYVADSDNHRVQIYNSDRIYVTTLGVTGEAGSDNSHFRWPIDVCVDGNGDIYVADAGNHRVQKFNSSYVHQYTLGETGGYGDDFGHFEEPSGVALDVNGNIYVADRYNHRVQVFSSNGAYLTTIGGDRGSEVGRFREPTGVDVDSAGNVYVADHHNHRIQKFAPGVPGWEQVNVNGFGNRNNRAAWSLGTFNDALYVSTLNLATGAEVYRLSSNSWEQVVDTGFGDSWNVAIDWFAEFKGHLYAGTWNGSTGGQIWRSPTGDSSSWEWVVDNGFGDSTNGEIMVLAPFEGYLYAGTWSYDTGVHGAEIWRSATGNEGSWTRVASDGFNDDSDNVAILSIEVFNGHLYASTYKNSAGGEIWHTDNGVDWAQVNDDGFGNADNIHVVSLEVYKDALYAGTWNSEDGGEIWRTTNGTNWEQVMSGGFGNVDNSDIASLVAFDGYLYAIVGNFETGPEVWRSSTGHSGSWEKITDTGFGCGRAAAVDWDNVTAVFNDDLYIGTFTWGNGGGRVWRKKSYAVYLPLILRSSSSFVSPYEPNNGPSQAHGPLQPGVVYRAYPDDTEDWYVFTLPGIRDVTVDVEKFTAGDGRLMVYAEHDTTNPVAGGYDGSGGPTMRVTPSGLPAGTYYVRVYTGGSTNTSTLYSLTVSY
jgi:hypothetical protein